MSVLARRLGLKSMFCASVVLVTLIAGQGCPTPQLGAVLDQTFDIPAGGFKTTNTFRLESGVLYSFRFEGNASTDPDAVLQTEAGSVFQVFETGTSNVEFQEITCPTGNYSLMIYNYPLGTSNPMTVHVTVTRN